MKAPPPNTKIYKPGEREYPEEILKSVPDRRATSEEVHEWLESHDGERFKAISQFIEDREELGYAGIRGFQYRFIAAGYDDESARSLALEIYHLICAKGCFERHLHFALQCALFNVENCPPLSIPLQYRKGKSINLDLALLEVFKTSTTLKSVMLDDYELPSATSDSSSIFAALIDNKSITSLTLVDLEDTSYRGLGEIMTMVSRNQLKRFELTLSGKRWNPIAIKPCGGE